MIVENERNHGQNPEGGAIFFKQLVYSMSPVPGLAHYQEQFASIVPSLRDYPKTTLTILIAVCYNKAA